MGQRAFWPLAGLFCLLLQVLTGLVVSAQALWAQALSAQGTGPSSTVSLDQRLLMLQASFPRTILDTSGNRLSLATGDTLVIDDGQRKGPMARLNTADIEDMLSQIYPLGRCYTGQTPKRHEDPGRIRNDRLLQAIFGRSPAEVEAALTRVDWFGTSVSFNTRAGAAAALRRVAADLATASRQELRFLTTTGGTYNWRVIAGTQRLSAHSYAISIDLNPKLANYWRWSGGRPGDVPTYENQVPLRIVEAFERHGFIWGGKWYHYDTMHFEYRPELIAIGRLAEALGCAR